MKKIKFMRKAWKKFAAVFLSMILTVGLVSGALPLEVLAEGDKIVIIERLTLEGYDGEEQIPDGLLLGGYTVHGTGSPDKPIPAESMTYSIKGNVITWQIEIEPEEDLKQICLNVQNVYENAETAEYCWSRNISDDLTPRIQIFEDTLYLIRLMDVNTFYKDVYIGEGRTFNSLGQSMSAPATMKENHIFKEWNTAEGDFSLDMKASKPMVLYAVYSGHPTKDAWVWNYDSKEHWLECTCGERENVELHTEDGGTVVKEPTDTDPGEKTYRCTHLNCPYERSEVIRSSINYNITMNGYNNGDELPVTANIELWLWKVGSSSGEVPQKVELTRTRIEGNKFFYSCAVQDLDTYAEAYLVDGSGFRFPLIDAFLNDGVYEKEFD
ncbi:MAG: hypothetical protein K2I01_01655, partial [Lachnospiraceae bacterium]|nr:hypothetical protein [Lachnospiraceae bacterium]